MTSRLMRYLGVAIIGASSLPGCKNNSEDYDLNIKPAFVGAISVAAYDGASDDLLTAGLGKTGLQGTAPAADATNPSAAELRRLAIYNNYRGLVDITTNGGYGTLYGPNVDAVGNVTTSEGKIAGSEYVAYADDGSGKQNVTMMVQIPSTFNKSNPCIVSATSSGSRGVYGAIATAGEWGLKKGCAVAYTDKGTGNGVHDLATNTVNLINGVRQDAVAAGAKANFTIALSAAELAAYNAAYPNRVAVKHAHSQQNPEKDWGLHTLQAIEFAFYILNQQLADKSPDGAPLRTFKPDNTLVIASSVSNGAGAALAAAEQDINGLIDGVAVAEPNVQLVPNPALIVRRGSVTMAGSGKPLYDYFTFANLYQSCAALAASVALAPAVALVNATTAANRCASLKAKGLLTSTTTAGQADEALAALLNYGWQPEASLLHASHYTFATPAIAVTYGNTYGRFSVKDNLCGFSFAVTGSDFLPASSATAIPRVFATGNGVPPMAGINIVNNLNPTGSKLDSASVSASTMLADFNVDGALCLRNLVTGNDVNAQKVQQGMAEVRRSGNLKGKPAIIVHGRSDALVPVSFTSRPYLGINKMVEGGASKLSYVEVTNAQHFDAFLGNAALAGYDTRFVPLHRYFIQALDMVYNHLKNNAALPPSQVVRTTPRGGTVGAAPAITIANVPPISSSPATGDTIGFSSNTVIIPD